MYKCQIMSQQQRNAGCQLVRHGNNLTFGICRRVDLVAWLLFHREMVVYNWEVNFPSPRAPVLLKMAHRHPLRFSAWNVKFRMLTAYRLICDCLYAVLAITLRPMNTTEESKCWGEVHFLNDTHRVAAVLTFWELIRFEGLCHSVDDKWTQVSLGSVVLHIGNWIIRRSWFMDLFCNLELLYVVTNTNPKI